MNETIIISSSAEETENLAAKLTAFCRPGTVIALHGELGAGKTVFARGFARGLGITDPVSSPTFTIVQEYRAGEKYLEISRLFHIDLYRIESESDALIFGIGEFFGDENAVTLIEWAERIESLLPHDTIHVRIEYGENDKRIIKIRGVNIH